MDGATAIYTVLSGNGPLIAAVPVARIITDDALPGESLALPAIQIETISGVDMDELSYSFDVSVRQRIRIRIHAKDAAQRATVRALVRRAIYANRFPTVSGIANVVANLDGEGPDGLAPESDVRIGLIDTIVSYNQTRS